nr:squamosa promoter-binding-like protein 2 [Tanacetum cinerariifolium]
MGCDHDLASAKDYHRKHMVCDIHSKALKVIVAGLEHRFCHQCFMVCQSLMGRIKAITSGLLTTMHDATVSAIFHKNVILSITNRNE